MRQSVPGCGGGGQEEIIAVAFAPQLPLVAAADSAGMVRVWEFARWKMDDLHYVDRYSSPVLSFGSSSAATAAAFSPDGVVVAYGDPGGPGRVRAWDLATGVHERDDIVVPGEVTSLALSPDSEMIGVGTADGTVRLSTAGGWLYPPDAPRNHVHSLLTGHTGPVVAMAFGSDCETQATVGSDNSVRLWAVPSGEPTAVLW